MEEEGHVAVSVGRLRWFLGSRHFSCLDFHRFFGNCSTCRCQRNLILGDELTRIPRGSRRQPQPSRLLLQPFLVRLQLQSQRVVGIYDVVLLCRTCLQKIFQYLHSHVIVVAKADGGQYLLRGGGVHRAGG